MQQTTSDSVDTQHMGLKRAALSDVAKEAGVAVSTASAILRDEPSCRATQTTRERVFEAATKVRYRRNRLALGLRSQRTNLIGLIFDSLNAPAPRLAQLAKLEERASDRGYRVVIGNQQGNPNRERDYINEFLDYQVSGLILASSQQENEAILKDVATSGIPAITIDTTSTPILPDFSIDRVRGGYLQVQHLIQDVGCQKLAFLLPNVKSGKGLDKISGYKKALNDYGRAFDEQIVITYEYERSQYLHQNEFVGGEYAARELLKQKASFDGVVTMSDSCAIAIMRTLGKAGVRIPDDTALVGFGDQPFACQLMPSLTTIRQPLELGELALKHLLEMIENPQTAHNAIHGVMLEPELVIRESTRQECSHAQVV